MNTKIPVDKAIIDILQEPIPATLIQEREQGRQKLSYISGSTVIDYLNRAFGYLGWDWVVIKEWLQESQPKFNPKYDKEPQPQAPVAHVLGMLTVYATDENGKEVVRKRNGYGSKVVVGGASEQDSIFKAAGTDALKKAASLFGIGAQLYRSQEEQDYFDEVTYEDPWTDEVLAETKADREYLHKVKEEQEWSDDALDTLVSEWSDGDIQSFADMMPNDFKEFVAYVKEQMEEAESAS